MQDMAEEFMELCRIDAGSKDERSVADAIKARLEALGLEVSEDGAGQAIGGNTGNLFTVLDGGLEGSVLFMAHMDRVAGGRGIKPRIEGDRIVSDGTTILAADDLSGVVSILDGIRRLKAQDRPFPRVEILFTVAEEIGLLGAKNFDVSRLRSKVGYALDSPGPLGRIVNSSTALARLTCEVFGKSAHAGNCPEQGVNAVIVLAKILSTIRDGRLSPESTANFALLETGNPSVNAVQDYAKVTGETRCFHMEGLQQYLDYFAEHCQRVAQGTGARVETSWELTNPSFFVSPENPVIQKALGVFEEMSVPIVVERGGGGMDANILNSRGICCVGLAMGYSGNHGTGESLRLADFRRGGEMVQRLALAWSS